MGKLSGAVGQYAAVDPEVERIACERLGLVPAPTSTQILQRDRHAELLSALALVASSLERFATEIRHLARTEVREVEEPFAEGQKGSSAMPHKRNPIVAERICGLARVVRANAVVGLENVTLWHERDISHSSSERVVLPDSFLAVDYMLDRFAWLVEGLVVRPERMRANINASHGLYASQRLLLALVESGLARDDAYRRVQRHAMRAWDEDLDFPTLVRGDDELAAAGRPRPRASRSMRTSRTSTRCSSGCGRSGRPARRPSMREALHVGSGKVRELYALDDERLLLVASDRLSTYDVVLPTAIPDKGRVLSGLSAYWFTRTRDVVPNHFLALRPRRPLDRMRPAHDAARRVRRARLSCRVRVGRLSRDRRALRAPAPQGLRESERLPTADRDPGDEVGCRDTTSTSRRPRRPSSAGRSATTWRARRRSCSTGLAAEHAASCGIVVADTKFEFGVDRDGKVTLGDEALTPDSSRFWPLEGYAPGPAAAVVRQAVRARLVRLHRLGPDGARVQSCRRTSLPGRAAGMSRRSSG